MTYFEKQQISIRDKKLEELFQTKKQITGYALVLVIFGFVAMIVENEFYLANIYTKFSVYSISIKCFITISTAILLIIVWYYHKIELNIVLMVTEIDDWSIVLRPKVVCQVALELLICAIHPIPIPWFFRWTTVHADGVGVTSVVVSYDAILSIFMLLRLYWATRFMLLYSRLPADMYAEMIYRRSKFCFNSRFMLKTLMVICPGTFMCVIVFSWWLASSWVLRTCEAHHDVRHKNYLNSVWMICISFFSIGYGDIVPNTYCGRFISIATGTTGAASMSLMVAVVARKLDLTKAERHVHNCMLDHELTEKLRHAAASVIQHWWLMKRCLKHEQYYRYKVNRKKYFESINNMHSVNRDMRELSEDVKSLLDVSRSFCDLQESMITLNNRQYQLERKVEELPNRIAQLVLEALEQRNSHAN